LEGFGALQGVWVFGVFGEVSKDARTLVGKLAARRAGRGISEAMELS